MKTTTRNFVLHLFDAVSFVAGMTMCSLAVVFPALLKHFSSSPVVMSGPIYVSYFSMMIVQIFAVYVSKRVIEINKKIFYYFVFELLHRLSFVILGVVLSLKLSEVYAVSVFSLILWISYVVWGFSGMFWVDTLSITIPDKVRGRFLGLRDGVARVISLPLGGLAAYFLSRWSFPDNYVILFLVGGTVFSVGMFGIPFLKPVNDVKFDRYDGSFKDFVLSIHRSVWVNRKFKKFLVSAVVFSFSLGIVPFVMPFVVNVVLADVSPAVRDSIVGRLNFVFAVGMILAPVLLGFVNDHLGPRFVIAFSSVSVVVSAVLLMVFKSVMSAYVVHLLIPFALYGDFIGILNWAMSLADAHRRTEILSYINLYRAPFTALFPVVFMAVIGNNFSVPFVVFGISGLVSFLVALRSEKENFTSQGKSEVSE